MSSTIFVPLASLPDKELTRTIQEIFQHAARPDRVYVAVVAYDQPWITRRKLIALTKRYKNLTVEFCQIPSGSFEEKISRLGVGANRNAATRRYSGQDYVLQVDAHTMVAKNWDTTLIELHNRAKEEVKGKEVILTAYATPYGYVNGKRKFLSECFTYSSYTSSRRFFDIIPGWSDFELNHFNGKDFLPAAKFCANFSFSPGSFALADSLPDGVLFYEEEPIQSVELFSKGFAMVFPIVTEPLVGHLYINDITSKSHSRKALMDYAPNSEVANSGVFMARVKENYLGYLARNRDKVKAYEKYAKTNLRLGAVNPALKVPEEY